MKYFYVLTILIISQILLNNSANAGPISDLVSWAKNSGTLNNNLITASNVKYGPRSKDVVDVYRNKLDKDNLKPCVIFVHGGAWVKGDKYNFIEVGASLSRNGYVAFLPNYTLFPTGNIEDMVDDIHRMIRWVWYYGYLYGADKDKITLVGYSAGAHVVSLTIVKTALKMYNKNEELGDLPRLEKLVLISGPYNINDIDQLSNLFTNDKVENGIVEKIFSELHNSKEVSPTNILRKVNNVNIDFGMPKITFYWADEDDIIPESSALDFMEEIRRVSPQTTVQYIF
ncbi:alpha/beta-hydrolase [Neocallimastix californiae]|uniref:Alpha/beta-hydrolase n=1 Tax=Neocallimastix californiae TaxID=1754190 RepID=A0A1Y1Z836_9FUNG|nr:alpha/beta-hydrolase [Neocallimastix californiae]|eukprot:ORY06423.1 alpha/beta-hydrolase [Neocallimastix californiae]